ncbi:C3 and PZP-like alpha-2-macroglobulin domain-containing protein 8 [Zootermopsis nevadensis]|uniref:C3 and PZP-like alpha-2-macroglobulin domain-containing protein 8 n=1 Tax=Zootermopsis nevadensis TaxID=136037 RepID=A0A067RSD1_ZOONE|nr:C3 and PZP-like alpha-2-macroglobulin domain-containing protein 8 [Zootermopsis nevadensis]
MTIEFTTEDKLEYQFNPVTSGALHFKVKAANDAHIALTAGPAEGDPMYEIFIGGWGNSKTAIRRNRQKPDKALADTPDILSDAEYRGFWIRWTGGSVAVGKEGEVTPFATWDDPEPFGIGYYGICTGWGASGSWLIEGGAEITTVDNLEYSYRPVPEGALHIEVRAPSNAHIALTSANHETEPMYEILLGGWENTASVIRYNRQKPDKVRVDTPGLLTNSDYSRFFIEWKNGHLKVKKNGSVLIEWQDPSPFGISHFGVRTAWGAQGHWRVKTLHPSAAPASQPGWNLPTAPPSGGAACWVDARGSEIPANAVPGGFDNEQLYVGRANHEGALIPGKIVPSHGVCYIAWGGQEHGKEEYQVLTGCEAAWLPSSGGQLPEGALPSGETEDGEPLFVGRASHEGTLTVGKVQRSHNVCYIPYGGQELAYPEYEVLVAK